MDPNAAWKELSECFTSSEDRDWERISEIADSLLHWLKRDGFPPTITGNKVFDRIVALRSLEAIVDWEVAV